jgi:hypothetical protein
MGYLKGIVRATLYVKVMPNRFAVRHIESGREVVVDSQEAFTTRRLLVGEFIPAADTLRRAFRQVLPLSGYIAAPRVVMHQTTLTEGGLSAVENRVLLEVADYAGAKRAAVWIGHDLSDDQVKTHANAA